jgi:hypothetical protein
LAGVSAVPFPFFSSCWAFLQKPFALAEFATKVRELLDPSVADEPQQRTA